MQIHDIHIVPVPQPTGVVGPDFVQHNSTPWTLEQTAFEPWVW
jgi:hypothetical protein